MSGVQQAQTPVDPNLIDELGRQVALLREQVAAFQLFNGRLMTDLVFTAAQTVLLDHKLGRKVRGWWEVTPGNATARVALTPAYAAGDDLARHLRVTATNAGTCSIWVF